MREGGLEKGVYNSALCKATVRTGRYSVGAAAPIRGLPPESMVFREKSRVGTSDLSNQRG